MFLMRLSSCFFIHLYLFVERSHLSNQIDRELMQDLNWQTIQQQATFANAQWRKVQRIQPVHVNWQTIQRQETWSNKSFHITTGKRLIGK